MLPSLERKDKSTTEYYSPKFRKASAINMKYDDLNSEKHRSNVSSNPIFEFSSINVVVERLEKIINDRMGTHERELLSIMKKEIESMLVDIEQTVHKLNKMMKEKNFDEDLWKTRNEVEYFKFEAVRLFEDNNNLRDEIQTLKKEINRLNLEELCQSSALKRIAKKFVKEKTERRIKSEKHCDESRETETCMKNFKSGRRNQYLGMTEQVNEQHHRIFEQESSLKKGKSFALPTKNTKEQSVRKSVDELEEIVKVRYSEPLTLLNSPSRSNKLKFLMKRQEECRSGFELKELMSFEKDEKSEDGKI